MKKKYSQSFVHVFADNIFPLTEEHFLEDLKDSNLARTKNEFLVSFPHQVEYTIELIGY